jgi:peptidoglycan/xylan/chitin deacetylase (PgdA/CDA1 family)
LVRVKNLVLVLASLAVVVGCKPPPAETIATAEATPTPAPTAVPEPTPTPFVVDKTSQVIVLCYHRFDDKPRDSLSISPANFEKQMQALKDNGITVISMDDFLAWRRGEKNIPAKSALIGIDDGFVSGYTVAWPILKKFGYPFTMYIYTDYVKGGPRTGGQSIAWDQLAEMRDAGVDIGSHTLTHSALNARKGRSDEDYRAWLQSELNESKAIIEQQLGIAVRTLAYPYGLHNEVVREVAMQAGYEAAFTVYGQRLGHDADPAMLGRYAIESTKPKVFDQAIVFSGPAATAASASTSEARVMPAAATMLTQPMQGETISNPLPEIRANLAALGNIDPKSVTMRISGIGPVPAKYDPESKLLSYQMVQKLRSREVSVIVSATADGRKVETRWSFGFDPSAKPAEAPAQ